MGSFFYWEGIVFTYVLSLAVIIIGLHVIYDQLRTTWWVGRFTIKDKLRRKLWFFHYNRPDSKNNKALLFHFPGLKSCWFIKLEKVSTWLARREPPAPYLPAKRLTDEDWQKAIDMASANTPPSLHVVSAEPNRDAIHALVVDLRKSML